MLKKEQISLLKDNEKLIFTLHRHWIILVFHFLYFIALFATSVVILRYQESIIALFGSGFFW